MHSVHVSSQLLVSVLFIAVPTNTEILKFFLHLYIYVHTSTCKMPEKQTYELIALFANGLVCLLCYYKEY